MDRMAETPRPAARERILDTAYELFSRRGIQGVGVDELIRRSEVAKATFYHHFPSKDDLVIAFLERHEAQWTGRFTPADINPATTEDAEQTLLGIFDVLDEWIEREGLQAGSFARVLLEMGPEHPAGQASLRHLAKTRAEVRDLAGWAGLNSPDELADDIHLLIEGAVVAAAEGDARAAQRAKRMAERLIEDHRE